MNFNSDPEQRQVFSIGQINSLAKDMLETVTVWVEGEVSEFKGSNSRYYYLYFTLKDTAGDFSLPAVVVRQTYPYLGLELENGQRILAQGKLSLFTKTGSYQFMVNKVELAGAGALAAQLEKLKQQLQKEGLLDQDRKRPLPPFPQRIGVITSIVSDAWADFQRHSIQKFPAIEIVVADSYVQGPKAPTSLLNALQALQQQSLDLIVITRGGGSAEDLAAFNDETFVRAIAASPIPTLVAVGHEKDISIADLVADIRASTPTNAGQIITRDYEDALVHLQHLQQKIIRTASYNSDFYGQKLDHLWTILSQNQRRYQALPVQLQQLSRQLASLAHQSLKAQQQQLDFLQHRFSLSVPDSRQYQQAIDTLKQQLIVSQQTVTTKAASDLKSLSNQLHALSPTNILARGYALAYGPSGLLSSVSQFQANQPVRLQLKDGTVQTKVIADPAPHSQKQTTQE